MIVSSPQKGKCLTRWTLLLAASLLLGAVLAELTESFWEEQLVGVKKIAAKAGLVNYWIVDYDSSGVPFVDYGSLGGEKVGRRYNPVTVSQSALSYYQAWVKGDSAALRKFWACVDWLLSNGVLQKGGLFYEYHFPFAKYQLPARWKSGMAQGQALQVFVRAFDLSKDSTYLRVARSVLNGFLVDVQEGGVTLKSDSAGWWFEEYASPEGLHSWVLNGMQYALLGIHDYAVKTRDSTAVKLFDLGILALKRNLPRYDADGYSYYDQLGTLAGKTYHQIHIDLLNELFTITKEPIFREYAQKWQRYFDRPFVFRLWRHPTQTSLAVAWIAWGISFLFVVGVQLGIRLMRQNRRQKIRIT